MLVLFDELVFIIFFFLIKMGLRYLINGTEEMQEMVKFQYGIFVYSKKYNGKKKK